MNLEFFDEELGFVDVDFHKLRLEILLSKFLKNKIKLTFLAHGWMTYFVKLRKGKVK